MQAYGAKLSNYSNGGQQPQMMGQQIAQQIQQQYSGQGQSAGATVVTFPSLAAAQGQLQGCPVSIGDNITYVPKETLIKHTQNFTKVWYEKKITQQAVATATAVQIVTHPTVTLCPPEEAAPCAVAAPAPCATGVCGTNTVAVGPSFVNGSLSQSPFRF